MCYVCVEAAGKQVLGLHPGARCVSQAYPACSQRPAAALCAHLGSVTPGLPGSCSSGGISGLKFCITLNSTCAHTTSTTQAAPGGNACEQGVICAEVRACMGCCALAQAYV